MSASPSRSNSDLELARFVAESGHRRQALELLYQRYAGRLLAFLRTQFRNHAEDIHQDTWIRADQAMQKGQFREGNFRAWIFRIAVNCGRSQFRSLSFATTNEESSIPERNSSDSLDRLMDRERQSTVQHCYEELRQHHPEFSLVLAAFLAGEKPVEASQRLGISRANYDQRKLRAMKILQTCVEKHLP